MKYRYEIHDGMTYHHQEGRKMKDIFAIFIVWTALLAGMAATSAVAIRLSVRRQSWGQPQAPCVTKPKPDCGMTLREWASAPAEVPACQK